MTDEYDEYQTLQAPDGLTAATWKTTLKKLFPEPVEGTCREISPELAEQLRLAKEAAAYWSDQASLVKAKIRQEMGNNEIATIDGVPFMVRRLIPYSGHWISAGTRDALMPPPKEER